MSTEATGDGKRDAAGEAEQEAAASEPRAPRSPWLTRPSRPARVAAAQRGRRAPRGPEDPPAETRREPSRGRQAATAPRTTRTPTTATDEESSSATTRHRGRRTRPPTRSSGPSRSSSTSRPRRPAAAAVDPGADRVRIRDPGGGDRRRGDRHRRLGHPRLQEAGEGHLQEVRGVLAEDRGLLRPAGAVVHAVSCDSPHQAEVFATFTLAGTKWPGNTAAAAEASGGCASRLTGYLNPQLAISLTSTYVYPDAVAWQAGTRTVICEVRAASGQTSPGRCGAPPPARRG